MAPSVLVVTPTCKEKDYALEHFIECYNRFEYQNKQLLICDTTQWDSEEYLHDIEAVNPGLTVRHYIHRRLPIQDLLTIMWNKVFIPNAQDWGFDWIFHLEIDVYCPSYAIDALLGVAEIHDANMVSHSYPARRNHLLFDRAIGCMMWESELFDRNTDFKHAVESHVRPILFEKGKKYLDMTNFMPIVHFDYGEEFDYAVSFDGVSDSQV